MTTYDMRLNLLGLKSKNKMRDKDAAQLGSASKNNVAINKHI